MLKQIYEIDENGYIKEIYVTEFDEEGNCLEEFEGNIITVGPPQGLYRAMWNGEKWIEDMSQEEIDELNNQPKELAKEEILEQRINELELYILTQEGLI